MVAAACHDARAVYWPGEVCLAEATLTISNKNYSSWSLRGWLLVKFSGLHFDEDVLPVTDVASRAELLILSPSMLVPCLRHEGRTIWNNLAIGEYLAEIRPEAGLMPSDLTRRARCRSICGEMHSGFASMRSALPMNLRGDYPSFRIWSRAQADIERICAIWRDCLDDFGGPFLMGAERTVADAMFAPVCTRFKTYHVALDTRCQGLLRPHPRPARDARMDGSGAGRAGRDRGTRDGVLGRRDR